MRVTVGKQAATALQKLQEECRVFKVDVFNLDTFLALVFTPKDWFDIAVFKDGVVEVYKPENLDDFAKVYRNKFVELEHLVKEFKKDLKKLPENMPCCGVFAVATVTGLDFEEVFEDFRVTFGKQKNWRGRTNRTQYVKMLRKYGSKVTQVETKKMNLRRWVAVHTKKDVTYVVTTTGHVQVVRNGIVTDQHGVHPIGECRGAGKMVNNVLEMV